MRIPRGNVELRIERDELEGIANALLRFEEEARAEGAANLALLDEGVDEEGDVLSNVEGVRLAQRKFKKSELTIVSRSRRVIKRR